VRLVPLMNSAGNRGLSGALRSQGPWDMFATDHPLRLDPDGWLVRIGLSVLTMLIERLGACDDDRVHLDVSVRRRFRTRTCTGPVNGWHFMVHAGAPCGS